MWSFASVDLMGHLLARASVIALALLVNEEAAGLYATGVKLIEAACLPLLFLSTAAYPGLCKAHRLHRIEFVAVTRRLLWFNVFAAGAIAASMYWLVPQLLVPVFGERYAGTELIIASMALIAFGQAVELMPGRILFAANQHISRAVLVAGAALLGVALNVVFILRWGLSGAIAATSITYVVLWLLYQQALRRERHNLLRTRTLAGELA
jgi:O-antigen/teichoic acid export membrane protein